MNTKANTQHLETAHELFERFDQLNAIGTALSAERDLSRLLEIFIMQRVYMTYAKQFLHQDQRDEIDRMKVLERARAAS